MAAASPSIGRDVREYPSASERTDRADPLAINAAQVLNAASPSPTLSEPVTFSANFPIEISSRDPKKEERLFKKIFDEAEAKSVHETEKALVLGTASDAAHAAIPEVPLFKQYIDLIKDGSKTIEGRVDTAMYANLRVGQTVRFYCIDVPGGGEVRCEITKINKYPSFAAMLASEEYKRCLPQIRSIEEGVRIYDAIPNYKERAATFGVLAIHIKRLE